MKARISSPVFIVAALVGGCGAAFANVSPPAQRTTAIKSAQDSVNARSNVRPFTDPVPNPFLWPVEESLEEPEDLTSTAPLATSAAIVGIDTLTRVAARIPATGTMTIGGDTVLLLGQKRLKVGDSVDISFEGQSYELVISDLQATSFTVRYRGLSVSRPIRFSSSSPTQIRP